MSEELLVLAKRQNDAMRRRFSTYKSKFNYKIGQIRYLNGFIYVLIWAYFILAAVLLFQIFVGKTAKRYNFYVKFGVLIVLILFPYVITPLEMFFLRLGAFIIETITGNVFNRPDHEFVVDYSYVPKIFSY
jgi:hypothetical protein